MSVAEWMTKDPVVTSADSPLEESLATMIRHRVRHLPILEGDAFVGLLSAPSLAAFQFIPTQQSVLRRHGGVLKPEPG